MEIHNLMEELVSAVVERVSKEDAESEAPRYCSTLECLTDAMCYVLNRVHPRYVSSGRGFAHLTKELQKDQQLSIDLVRLAHEGLHRVSVIGRSYYGTTAATHVDGPCFNFPTVKGRLLDGARFSPVTDVDVSLLRNGQLVEMFDSRWTNPYRISDQTPGTFLFWPAPLSVDTQPSTGEFSFELRVEDRRYETLSHFFTVAAKKEERENRVFTLERDFTLPDLYLFQR